MKAKIVILTAVLSMFTIMFAGLMITDNVNAAEEDYDALQWTKWEPQEGSDVDPIWYNESNNWITIKDKTFPVNNHKEHYKTLFTGVVKKLTDDPESGYTNDDVSSLGIKFYNDDISVTTIDFNVLTNYVKECIDNQNFISIDQGWIVVDAIECQLNVTTPQGSFKLLKFMAPFVITKIDITEEVDVDTTYNGIAQNILNAEEVRSVLSSIEKEAAARGYQFEYKVSNNHDKNIQTYYKKGGYTIELTPDDKTNFVGIITINWMINKADINNNKGVKIINPMYDGSVKAPTVEILWENGENKIIKLSSSTTTKGSDGKEKTKDYSVSYDEKVVNVNPDGYPLTIKGINNFTGTIEDIWGPTPVPREMVQITLDPERYTYTGKPLGPPTAIVTFMGKELVINQDYSIVASSEINANTTEIPAYYINIKLMGNFDGEDNLSWYIDPKTIDESWVTLTPESYAYTGKPLGPPTANIVDPDCKYQLIKNVDYELKDTKEVGPGTFYVNITGKGNYTGSVDKEWTIFDPISISGYEAHVNVIDVYKGVIDVQTLKDNTFLYDIHKNYPEFCSEDFMITVESAWGDTIIENDTFIQETPSQWNRMWIYGINAYKDFIVCDFYINVVSEYNYDVGTSFTNEGITYTVTSVDNKTVSVTGYEAGIQAGIAIPDYVEGFKVTKIGTKAFYGCKTITSVDLGENITSVGIKAFANCTKLETVVFDDALKTISAYAFYNCGKLTSIDLPDKVRTIGSYAFYKCNALTSVSFDDALKTVGTKAFTVSFENASGKVLKQTAKNLAGKTFEGPDKVLKLVA